jgi:glycosyltransferase involved in cell wall biosynthesis
VLIDATYARRAPRSGTGVYIRRLLGELGRLGDVEAIAVANPRRRAPGRGGAASAANLLCDLWWTAVALPALALRLDAQVVHHPLPALAPWCPVAQVVTVHDLAFERHPQLFAPGFRRFARIAHRHAARRAAVVICVSATTAADVRELWEVGEERILVAALGPGQADEALSAASSGASSDEAPSGASPGTASSGASPGTASSAVNPGGLPGYLLYVGDGEPRKNLTALLAAYARYRAGAQRPLELVLAGRVETITAPPPGVRVVREPDRAHLHALYRGATALVHASLHEGFGLTVLEAMALGVPVLAAPSPGVVEVCGEAVRYSDPSDPDRFGAAIAALADDPAARERLRQLGLRRAGSFDWARCARLHRDAYSLALVARPPGATCAV